LITVDFIIHKLVYELCIPTRIKNNQNTLKEVMKQVAKPKLLY
jgi:hypothetical protein